jgi:hypothetical protein
MQGIHEHLKKIKTAVNKAGLQNPVLTPNRVEGRLNRKYIQRHDKVGKQAHLCKALRK